MEAEYGLLLIQGVDEKIIKHQVDQDCADVFLAGYFNR